MIGSWSPRDTLDAAARVAELSHREAVNSGEAATSDRETSEPPKPAEPTLEEVRGALRELDGMAAGPGTAQVRRGLVELEAAIAGREPAP